MLSKLRGRSAGDAPDTRRERGGRTRSFSDDRRAVAPLVGFILLLGILITALAVYQVQFVPQQNAEVEFDHSQDISSDMEDLRAASLGMSTTAAQASDRTSVRLQLGMQYPPRLVALNPPPAQGWLQTHGGTVSIQDAAVVGSFSGEPETTLLNTEHETRLVQYDPDYSEYQGAPDRILLEHSLLYNQQRGANTTVATQRLVQNESKSINLVLFSGNLDLQRQSTTVDLQALDGPSASVPIESETGDSFELTLPTRSPQLWTSEDILGSTFTEGEQNVRAEQTGPEEVTLTVNDDVDQNWELQVTRVGLGSGPRSDTFSSIQPVDPVGPEVTLTDNSVTVTQGDTVQLSGEATSESDAETVRTDSPIEEVRVRIDGQDDELFEIDPADDETIDFEDEGLTIDTTGWNEGSYTAEVRARDSERLWTPWEDADSFQIIIDSPD